jgi:hypothetical protein
VERRTDRIQRLQLELDNYGSTNNELMKKLYRRKLEKQVDASNEYAMISRAFLKRWLKPERRVSEAKKAM